MKFKFYLIIVCLIIFGCQSKEEPVYITRIGLLTPGGGGIPTLEVWVNYGLIKKTDNMTYIIYIFVIPMGNLGIVEIIIRFLLAKR